MDLNLSEEQQVLREMLRGLLTQYAPLEVVRQMEDDPRGYPEELWKQLGELGVLGLLIPESHGGGEQSLLEAVILYEELGRALAPTPHLASAVLGARALLEGGSPEQQKAWLPSIASGETIFAPAWYEPDGGHGPRGVQLRAEADADGFRLSGVKRHVPFASSAARLVLLARSGDADGELDLWLVDPSAPGVTLSQQKSLGSDTQYRVELADLRVTAADRLGSAGTGWESWEAVMFDAIVLLAAQAVGGAERALEITVEYAKDRVQFDKPLGAFQSISHYLADAATAVDGARTLVYEAAWARSEGRPHRKLAAMAKLFACQTYRDLTAMAQQVWGGVGFTVEYDIQLFFRRAKQLEISYWDTAYLEERVAQSVLDD